MFSILFSCLGRSTVVTILLSNTLNSVSFARCHWLHCYGYLPGKKSFMWCCAATEHSPLNTTSWYIPRLIFSVHFLMSSCLFRFCQLTRWSRTLLDSLIIAHIFNRLSEYYTTRRFITALTTGSQLILILNHMSPYRPVYLRTILILSPHLCVHLRHGLFPSGLPAKTQHAFLVLPQQSHPFRFDNPNNNIQNSLLAERCISSQLKRVPSARHF